MNLKTEKFKSKATLVLLFKVVVTLLLFLFLINYITYDKIVVPLLNANYYLVSVAAVLMLLNIYLQFRRWEIVCNTTLMVNDRRKIFLSLFYGFSGGMITPMRVGEYIGRTIAVENVSTANVTAATLADKFFALLIILFAGTQAAVLFLFYLRISTYIFIAIFLTEIIVFGFFYYKIFYDNLFREKLLMKISGIKVFKFRFEEINVLNRINITTINRLILISIFAYTTFILQYALFVAALSNGSEILNYFWIGSLVIFAKSIIPPITFSELGIREAASVYFVTYFGLTEAVGFNAAMFLFIVNILLPSLTGTILFLRRD